MSAALGFTFDFSDDMRMLNTFRSHQVIDWARDQGRAHGMALAQFGAFFTRREDVNDPTVLAAVTDGIGLDGMAVPTTLENEVRAYIVREQEHIWSSCGVTGARAAMILQGEHLVSGAQDGEACRSLPVAPK